MVLVVVEKVKKPIVPFDEKGVVDISKRSVDRNFFIRKLQEVKSVLERNGVPYTLAGSAYIVEKLGEEKLKEITFRSNVDVLVDDPKRVSRLINQELGGFVLKPEDTDGYIVQDIRDDSLYILPLFPTAWNVVDREGFVITLIPRKRNAIVHANVREFPIIREVDTITPEQPVVYKFIRGSNNDIAQLKALAEVGLLSDILKRLYDHLVPYSVVNKFHRVMKLVIKSTRSVNPSEARRLREIYTSVKKDAKRFSLEPHLAPRHPIPVTASGKPFLPPGERLVIDPDEIKRKYMIKM